MSDEMLGNVEWYRGDSYPIAITIKDKKTKEPIPLTDYTITMTVDPRKNPDDDSQNLFSIQGTINTGQLPGKVVFFPSADNTNFPEGEYYYDIQMKHNNDDFIKTIAKYKWIQRQDITK